MVVVMMVVVMMVEVMMVVVKMVRDDNGDGKEVINVGNGDY